VIHAVAATIRGYSFRYATEEVLQTGLAGALEAAGFDVQREVRLDARSRLDILVGRVAVEVKVAGSTRGVRAQLMRYLMSDAIDGVVLVTNRVRHLALPSAAFGKPIIVVDLVGAGL
jgi:predicted ATP-grasp superfamily ATP-dependent carboligase